MEKEIVCKKGKILCNEGEYEHFMYDIIEGSVEVIKDYELTTQRVIATLDSGFIGEMGMNNDNPRTATVIAATDCRLVKIDATSMDDYLLKNPEKTIALLRQLSARLRELDRKYLESAQVISDYLSAGEDADKTGIISRMQEFKDILASR